MTDRAVVCLVVLFGSYGSSDARAQTAEQVAVVINASSADSTRIGEHYARVRHVPPTHIIRITTPSDDAITRTRYVADIETPIATALGQQNLQDRVLYLVLTKGVPLRIEGTTGQEGTIASVDSELTLLYRRMTGREVTVRGRVANPYYLGTKPLSEAASFTHRLHDIYLVTRLTAYTADEAVALIDRAQAPSRDGRFVLDQRAGVFTNPAGDRQLSDAHQRLRDLGIGERAILESTTNAAPKVDNVLGYYSWGSNDPELRGRATTMTFAPGAIAAMFVSADARTFDEPPAAWRPTGDFKNRTQWFRGSPQSLSADLIREGVTGVAGHVGEPYLQSAVRPDILFPAYVSGFNLVEAFYLALPDLGWQTVVVGDPLCAPFDRPRLLAADLDPGVDPETELPAWFSARRTDVARGQLKTVPAAALSLYLRAETRIVRGDKLGARAPLETATVNAPDFAAAHLQLGLLLEEAHDFAGASERYRAVLKAQPNNLVALNNLAYNLAVHQQNATEALPYARRAFALFPKDARVADTYAWVEHLAGNSEAAARLLRTFAQRDTGVAELHLHAALVFAALGDLREAERQLGIAVQRDPALAASDDVRRLRERVKK